MPEKQSQYIIDLPYAYKMWDKEKNTELSPENTTVSGNINRVIPKGYYYWNYHWTIVFFAILLFPMKIIFSKSCIAVILYKETKKSQ